MRIADFTTPAANLREAFDKLEIAWQDAQEDWDDPGSRNIEENHLAKMRLQIRTTLDAIHRIADILDQAQRDCEEDENW